MCFFVRVCIDLFFLYVHDFLRAFASPKGERWLIPKIFKFARYDFHSIFDFRVRSRVNPEKPHFPANFRYTTLYIEVKFSFLGITFDSDHIF